MKRNSTKNTHASCTHTLSTQSGQGQISAALAKWQIYDPLHAAEEGRNKVWVWGTLIAVSIILGVFGLALIVFGKKPNEWLKIDLNNMSWKQAVFFITFSIVCLAVYIWVDRGLAAQGYK